MIKKNESSIVGVWKESKFVIYSGANNTVLSTELPNDCDKKNTYEFTSGGQYNIKTFYTNQSTGNCLEDGSSSYTYKYDSKTKKITINDETADVLSLTNNELQIVTDMDDENNDGVLDKFVQVLYK